jgi:hypothetical protein
MASGQARSTGTVALTETVTEKICADLRKLYLEAMGHEPDAKALRLEAEGFVARYGADPWFKDVFGNPF